MENKQLIIDKALDSLLLATGIEPVKRTQAESTGSDATVTISGNDFATIATGQVNTANVLSKIKALKDLQQKTHLPVLLVCTYVSPTVIPTFKEEKQSILDVAGNCLIANGKVFINIQGRKPESTTAPVNKVLTEAGIKLVFYFMREKANVANPYRKIHDDTGLSLGLIKNYIKNLTDQKYLTVHNNRRVLINRDELVEWWQQAFNSTLKPKLFIGRLRFVNEEARREWQDTALPPKTYWGGESGSNKIDGYLTPEKFTIYTEAAQRDFLMTRKLIPAPDGEVMLYQKFWKGDPEGDVAPSLIIYADLMGSGDSRCLEAAQRLKEHGL